MNMIQEKIKIIGISGSLRKASYHNALLREVSRRLPANAELEIVEIGNLPLFNQDLEMDLPEVVKEFKAKIKKADSVLFVSPEYNYSIPGVLKNAIDWASRPYGDNSLDGKAAAIMSGSISNNAGARMQYHLRQVMVFLDMHPLNRPEFMVPMINEKFDAVGNLIDEPTKEKISQLLVALASWTIKIKK